MATKCLKWSPMCVKNSISGKFGIFHPSRPTKCFT